MVGIDTDEYVLHAKGPGHPFSKQRVRAEVLASIAYVDFVVLMSGRRKNHADYELIRGSVRSG